MRDKYGSTPLMKAASWGQLSICKWFSQQPGFNPFLANEDGETVYHIAADSGMSHILAFFLDFSNFKSSPYLSKVLTLQTIRIGSNPIHQAHYNFLTQFQSQFLDNTNTSNNINTKTNNSENNNTKSNNSENNNTKSNSNSNINTKSNSNINSNINTRSNSNINSNTKSNNSNENNLESNHKNNQYFSLSKEFFEDHFMDILLDKNHDKKNKHFFVNELINNKLKNINKRSIIINKTPSECTPGELLDCITNTNVSPLQLAADQGKIETLRFLVEFGCNFNWLNDHSVSALSFASSRGFLKVTKFLCSIPNCSKIRIIPEQIPPLISSTRDSTGKCAEVILKYPEVDVNEFDSHGISPILYAATFGNVKVFKLLLNQPKIDINRADSNNDRLIHYIASTDQVECFKILLEFYHGNIDINLQDGEGRTPLMCAIDNSCIEMVKYLLTLDVIDITIRDHRYFTAEIHAARDQNILQLIQDYKKSKGKK